MRIASHIAAAPSAATGRSDRPNGWQLLRAPMAYWGVFSSTKRSERGSRLKPE
jgi:hypothetical protein